MSISTIWANFFGRTNQADLADQWNVSSSMAHIAPDARRLIRQRQYCRMLARNSELKFDQDSMKLAWEIMQDEMALAPPGAVSLWGCTPSQKSQMVEVNAFYIDRFCVTNGDFAQFVNAGGYSETQYWPDSILTDLLKFTDATGNPGPKYWIDGAPPKEKLDHPVVGISWFEANAYAQWAGKRLPTPAQWQRAGTWAKSSGGTESRYPWGNSFIQANSNTWSSMLASSVSVREFSHGSTPSGVHQLIGNVWEWQNGQFALNSDSNGLERAEQILAEVRGGAFDTYFASQATCQFRSGQPLLVRAPNIGFRCCVESHVLVDSPENLENQGAS
jgi:gamma-glutamyl hercynylcysteine S-oxide synthase